MLKRTLILIAVACLLPAVPWVVYAKGGQGKSQGAGKSAEHRGAGVANSNSQRNAGATRGQDRAAERRSEQGAAHQKATAAHASAPGKNKDQDAEPEASPTDE